MFETIVALATPPLKSALAIIRLSGDDCFEIVSKIFTKDLTKDLSRRDYTQNAIFYNYKTVAITLIL